jgi:hypothetical protein
MTANCAVLQQTRSPEILKVMGAEHGMKLVCEAFYTFEVNI